MKVKLSKRKYPQHVKAATTTSMKQSLAIIKTKTGKSYSALAREAFEILIDKYTKEGYL